MFKRIITYSILTFVTLFGFFGNINLDIVQNNGDIRGVTLSYEGNITYADCTTDPNSIPCIGANKAGTDPTKKPESTNELKMWDDAIKFINMAFMILSTIISPVILFAGWLMSPDWTSGDIFGMRPKMHDLWVTVSNIVYFVYAILLILIALGTMFGKDSFSYKAMLPKLALGIIMVPFTWWFVQWTISLSSVMTAQVMTIPLETIKGSKWFSEKATIPTEIRVGTPDSLKNAIKSCGDGTNTKDSKCSTPKDFLSSVGGMYGPLVVYAYSVFNINEITVLPTGLDAATAAIKIVHQSFIGMLMFLVFGLLVLALVTILLVRAIKLWVYAIFSPLFTFRFVAGSNFMGGDDDTFSIKEFIGLAFVPAIIGLTLSFGLIMVSTISSTNNSGSTQESKPCNLTGSEGCNITIMGDANNYINRKWIKSENQSGATDGKNNYITNTTFKWGTTSFIFEGKAINQSVKETQTTAIGALDAIGGTFGTIVMDIIALMFIWLAFMAAKNISKAVKAVAQPFEDMGNKVGSLAKSLPKYAPLPIPGGSISGLAKTGELASNKFEATMKQKELDNIGRFAPGLVEGVLKPKDIEIFRNATSNLKGEEGAKKIAAEIAKLQGTAKYTGGNNETIKQEISGKLDDNQINAILSSANIIDNKEKEIMTKFYKGESQDPDKQEKAWKLSLDKFGSGKGKDGGSGITNNINLNINPTGNEKDIASAIRGSNTEKTITRNDLETALKEKIKKPDGNIDTDKIKKILDEIKDDFFKKPGTSSGGGGGH